jgi:hypothetical protein
MAVNVISTTTSGGGTKRGRIVVQKTDSTAAAAASISIGTILDPAANNKAVVARVRALDSNKAESATLVSVTGRAVADGAGTFTVYVWSPIAAGITVPANSHFVIDWEITESVTSD